MRNDRAGSHGLQMAALAEQAIAATPVVAANAANAAASAAATAVASVAAAALNAGDTRGTIGVNEMNKIPDDMMAGLDKLSKKFENEVRRYIKSESQIERSKADVATFDGDTTFSMYPKGVRAFACPDKFRELDQPLARSATEDWTFSVMIPASTSRKEAMKRLHWSCAKFYKEVDLEAMVDHNSVLKPFAQKATFFKASDDLVAKYYSNPAEGMGLDGVVHKRVRTQVIIDRIESKYKEIIVKLAKEKETEPTRRVPEYFL